MAGNDTGGQVRPRSARIRRAAFASPEGQATARDIAELVPDGGIRSMIFELNDA